MNEVDSTELSEVPENPATGDPTSSDAIPAGNATLPDPDLSKTATFPDPVGTTDLFLLEKQRFDKNLCYLWRTASNREEYQPGEDEGLDVS